MAVVIDDFIRNAVDVCDNERRYQGIPKHFENEYVHELKFAFNQFEKLTGLNDGGLIIDSNILIDIAERLHQRIEYYSYFHNGFEMSQIKRIGILTYWLLKYRPINSKYFWTFRAGKPHYDVNVYFAFYFFKSSICDCRDELRKKNGEIYPCTGVPLGSYDDFFDGTLEELYLHSFSECDLSKEAFILLAETGVQSFN